MAPRRSLDWYFKQNPTVRYALPDRLRGLVDLKEFLSGLTMVEMSGKKGREKPGRGPRPVDQVVKRLWDNALDRSPLLGEQRDFLRSAVHFAPDRPGLVIENRNLVIGTTRRVLWQLPLAHRLTLQGIEPRWHVDFKDERAKLPAFKDVATRLPDHVLGALMLAVDVAAADPQSRLRLSLPSLPSDSHPVTVRYLDPAGREVFFPWPLPAWQSFRQYIQVARAWRDQGAMQNSDEIGRAYLGLVLDVIESGEVPQQATRVRQGWSDLADRVARLAATPADPSAGAYVQWAWARTGAPLLAALESGLQAGTDYEWRRLCEEKLPREIMAEEFGFARQRRAQRAIIDARLDGAEARALLEALESEVTGRRTSTPFIEELRSVEIYHPARSSARTPEALAGYFELLPDRQAALEEAAPELAGVLNEIVRANRVLHRGETRYASETVRSLWVAACRLSGRQDSEELVKVFTRDKKYYNIDNIRFARHRHERRGGEGRTPAHGGWDLRINKVSVETERYKLPLLLERLLRVGWDVTWDEEDMADDPAEKWGVFKPWWEGAEVVAQKRLKPPMGYPWPTPAWPALLDWEILHAGWNDLRVGKADMLAYWLCNAIVSVARDRSSALGQMEPGLPAKVAKEEWRVLMGEIQGEPISQSAEGLRWHCYTRWCERVPLLAAPESGLSIEAAVAILESWGSLSSDTRKMLQELRQERVRYVLGYRGAKVSEEQVTAELAAIREQASERGNEHPWYQQVGEG